MPTQSLKVLHRLRLSQLELVCVLAETGSLRAASERFHVSAPALSKSLREVERVAGADLFERSPRGLAPTAAGEAFALHARGILQRVSGLKASGPEMQLRPPRALLRIGTAPFVAWKLLPPALAALSTRTGFPSLQLVEGRIVPLAEQLVHGELDAIVTLFTPEALEAFGSAALALDQIRVERLLIVTAADDRTSTRKLRWKQLAERPWILPPATYSARIQLQRAFLEAGLVPPQPAIESINIPAMLALVRSGLGITPAFESTVREELELGSLRRLRMEDELPGVPLGLAYRKSSADLAAIHALRDALKGSHWIAAG
jgi:DNA-binding transcriptional LysR family regulator